jgi:hypothetical protein
MKDTERAVSYYDLYLESRAHGDEARHPRPVHVGTALDLARAHWVAGHSIGGASVKVTLADWTYSPRKREHCLVVNRADASMLDIPLRDIRTGATRMAGKGPSEGIDLTCHVLVRESTNRDKSLLLLTNGSSVPVDKICKLLTSLFRMGKYEASNEEHFFREHPSGAAGKFVSLNSNFAVGGHQNATLADLLDRGVLQGLELISEVANAFDTSAALAVTEVQYRLEPVGTGRLGVAAIQRAITALRRKGVDPTQARVRYRAPGKAADESKLLPVDALESMFVRKEVIRFRDPIADRYEKVEPRVMAELSKLADRETLG